MLQIQPVRPAALFPPLVGTRRNRICGKRRGFHTRTLCRIGVLLHQAGFGTACITCLTCCRAKPDNRIRRREEGDRENSESVCWPTWEFGLTRRREAKPRQTLPDF